MSDNLLDFNFVFENLSGSGDIQQQYRSLLGSLQSLDQETDTNSQKMAQWESLARQVFRKAVSASPAAAGFAGASAGLAGAAADRTNIVPGAPMQSAAVYLHIAGRPEPVALPVGEEETAFTIGRNPDNAVVLDDANASRRHARLERRGAAWWLVDLGSSNGTFINGQRLTAPAQLHPGDQARVGDTTFELSLEPSAPAYDAGATRIDVSPPLKAQPRPAPVQPAQAQQPQAQGKAFCRNCGQPVKPGAQFCRNCGQPVAGN